MNVCSTESFEVFILIIFLFLLFGGNGGKTGNGRIIVNKPPKTPRPNTRVVGWPKKEDNNEQLQDKL